MGSRIEWTQDTWNPIIGCSKISEGCKNCYAERMARRLYDMHVTRRIKDVTQGRFEDRTDGISAYSDVIESDDEGRLYGWNGRTAFVESALQKPLKRKKPTTYFVCDMGDIFHPGVLLDWIDSVFDVMAACPQHTFLLLTKRPENAIYKMHGYATDEKCPARVLGFGDYLPNVYIGVTVETQERADERIPRLLQIPAAGHFVSIEPMLGPIDLTRQYRRMHMEKPAYPCPENYLFDLDQVIVGGESGPNARPMHPKWVESLRDQCGEANVPFFFKQWGKWLHVDQVDDCADEDTRRWMSDEAPWQPNAIKNGFCAIGKKRAGRTLDGQTHDELIWQ